MSSSKPAGQQLADTRALFSVNQKDEKELQDFPRFTIASFNVLSQKLIKRELYPYCSKNCLRWSHRQVTLLNEFKRLNADIFVVQEMDFYQEYWNKQLTKLGYENVYFRRAGSADGHGVGIFFKSEKFKRDGYVELEFQRCAGTYTGDRFTELDHPNVGQILSLRVLDPKNPTQELSKLPRIVVTNCHLFWHPSGSYTRLHQAEYLLNQVVNFIKDEPCPVALCGDFNSTPDGFIYQYLTSRVPLIIDGNRPFEYLVNQLWLLSHKNDAVKSFCEAMFTRPADYDSIKTKGSDEKVVAKLLQVLETKENSTRLQQCKEIYENSLSQNLPLLESSYKDFMEHVPAEKRPTPPRFWQGEPPYSNYRGSWNGTLDYIFTIDTQRSPDYAGQYSLVRTRLLELPEEKLVSFQTALPNDIFASDHCCLMTEFALVPTSIAKTLPSQKQKAGESKRGSPSNTDSSSSSSSESNSKTSRSRSISSLHLGIGIGGLVTAFALSGLLLWKRGRK